MSSVLLRLARAVDKIYKASIACLPRSPCGGPQEFEIHICVKVKHRRPGNIKLSGSGGIRTHASEETGALNQRLRPLGHATTLGKLIAAL